MKRFLLLSVICLSPVIVPSVLHAQSAAETVEWLTTFFSEHGGAKSSVHPYYDKAFDTENGPRGVGGVSDPNYYLFRYAGFKTVKAWSQGGRYFVRITGECEEHGMKCPASCDIFLNDESSKESIDRMVKAYIHLAELNGAKVNQNELF